MPGPTWHFNPQPPRPAWGVRSATLKPASLQAPIVVAPLPDEVTLCLTQHELSARPAVQVGERVRTGQVVARHDYGGNIHASITGIVSAIGPRAVPGSSPTHADCICIRRDGEERLDHATANTGDPLEREPAQLCATIAAGGIVGLGGALFPAARKLAPGTAIRALLVNGAECEPWITCDEALLRERAAAVVDGTRIAMHALCAHHAVIAIEGDMPEARIALHAALQASGDARIGLATVTAKYPAGGERQLIELLTGEEVPAGRHPCDIGYVVHNVATLAAIATLFRSGQPLISRVVTVTGGCIASPGNFEVRLGTPMCDVIALAGGYRSPPTQLLMGGPMMGFALPGDSLPVTAATNCIVAALASEVPAAPPEMPCIRCGDCVQACPARLLPQELLTAVRSGNRPVLASLGVEDCIECGCCDFVCPSAIPLTVRFAAAKRTLGAYSRGDSS